MMMNLYRRNIRAAREPRRGTRALLAITITFCAIAVMDLVLGGMFRNTARSMLAPVLSSSHAASAAVFQGDFWRSRSALLREVTSLKMDIQKLRGETAGYDALRQENESLREMAKLAEENEGLTAPVISSFRSSPYGTFLIGAGREDGVVQNGLVLTDGGFVLGVVSEAAQRSATVQAVFSPTASLEVVVGTVAFTLDGKGGGNARAEVPRESELREGDAVLAPLYANRPVGVIGRIESASSSAYSSIYVVFPMNLNSIRYVYVIPPLE